MVSYAYIFEIHYELDDNNWWSIALQYSFIIKFLNTYVAYNMCKAEVALKQEVTLYTHHCNFWF